MNKILDRIRNWYLYGNFIFIVSLLSFGIYAVPGFVFLIKECGVSQFFHLMINISLYLYLGGLMLGLIFNRWDYDLKGYFIVKLKSLPKDIISVVVIEGYFFYFMYCNNYYTYLIPIFLLSILTITKKINLRRNKLAKQICEESIEPASEDVQKQIVEIKGPETESGKPISNEEMEEVNKFEISESGGISYLYMNFCSVGGCSLDGISYESYDTALKEGYKLSLAGKTPGSYVCEECRKDLKNFEEKKEKEQKDIKIQRNALRGTGNLIIEVADIECTECRMGYDSSWTIKVITRSGIEEVSLLYTDTNNENEIKMLLSGCNTVGDIKSHDMTGLIYYD